MRITINTKVILSQPLTLFGIAMPMLHGFNFQKCNYHLVSFIKVEGLFVSYIVTITWYRLSRLKVYLSHTLSTFLIF